MILVLRNLAPCFKKNILIQSLIFILTLLVLLGCEDSSGGLLKYQGSIMGTTYKVTLREPHIEISHSDIFLELDSVNQEMSTYISTSFLSNLNKTKEGIWFYASSEFLHVVSYSQELCNLSGGAFDISVGNLVNAWGFGPIETYKEPSNDLIERSKAEIGCNSIEIDLINKRVRKVKDVYVDLSAIAKGFAIDYLAEYLDRLKIENYLIELGGELKAKGYKANQIPWLVGIEHPKMNVNPILMLRTDQFTPFSLATSGNYRNYKKMSEGIVSHTFDPRKGLTVQNDLSSVSIISETAMKADALATTLHVLGKEEGLKFANQNKLRAIFISTQEDNFSIYTSKALDLSIN